MTPPNMQIIIATDAWEPQVNGVVRTYQRVREELIKLGHQPIFITPNDYKTMACPTYPEIRLAFVTPRSLVRQFKKHQPDIVHIATEGPIGWAARRACLKLNIPFTTAYHTRFPEYIVKRIPLPIKLLYKIVTNFHNASGGTMVATPSLGLELKQRGFKKIQPWTRGVNTQAFHPAECRRFGQGPVAIYVGRVAVEKNLESFLDLDFKGTKVIVGDGPSLSSLKAKYKDVIFTGALTGNDLAQCYASADVFVFPSLTDTFGIVMLEAMASGLPVAAYPVTGPIDVVENGITGILDENLGKAIEKAILLDRNICRKKAQSFSWLNCTKMFLQNLEDCYNENRAELL